MSTIKVCPYFPETIRGFKILTNRYRIDESLKRLARDGLIDTGVIGVIFWMANRVTPINF
jgi:hypothetical protein